MKTNWIIAEAEKADHSKDYVILQNPLQKDFIDNILLELWDGFKGRLDDLEYNSFPVDNVKIMMSESYEFTRYFEFMLFDDDKAFFRGTLSCSKEGWMIKSENFISLSIKNDPKLIFEILGNSRFTGNPPTLMIDKQHQRDYYQITFDHEYGAGWGLKNKKQALKEIFKVIDVSVRMHELTKEGFISNKTLGEFISIAYDIYEAY